MRIIIFLLLSFPSIAQISQVPSAARTVSKPAYTTLSGIEAIWDATGLKTGVDNEYGSVATDNNLLTLESIRPGPLGRDLTSTGTIGEAIKVVKNNGVTVMDFNGERWLRHISGAATWNFLSYNATFANMRHTVTMLVRPAYNTDHGQIVALLGNNAGSSGAKGYNIFMDDRQAAASANRRLSHNITRGVAGTISSSGDDNVIDFNEWHVYTFTFDASLAAGSRWKAYREKTQLTSTVTSASTAVVTTPTYDLEIMALGNSAVPASGQVALVVIQSVVESQAVREAFVDSLEPLRQALNNHQNDYFHIYNQTQDNGTRYYLPCLLAQDPTDLNTVVKVYRDDDQHVPTTGSKAMLQVSTDRGLTFGTASTVTDPTNPLGVGDLGGGYDATGRLWLFIGYRTNGSSAPFEAHVFYSDNDGTSFTDINVTAQLPADGLDLFSFWGNLVETPTGRLGFPFYKVEADVSQSANYFLYTDDDGEQAADWTTSTIRAPGSAYINETWSVIAGSRLIVYARDDDTNEWNVFSSSDWGTTWSDGGAYTLGETFTEPCPLSFSQFDLYGVNVTAVWWSDRQNLQFKVAFARTSSLATDPKSFDLDTKTIIRARTLHYGTVIHPYNDFYSIAAYPRENVLNPFGGENTLVSFFPGTILKDLVIKELGITRQ